MALMTVTPLRSRLGALPRLAVLSGVVSLAFAVPAVRAIETNPTREYAIKAAALFNFVPFIQWPPESFPLPDSPVVIGILGPDPFGPLIDRLVEHESFHGHPIQVVRYATPQEVGLCHVLFVSRGPLADDWSRLAPSFAHQPVLTVSDIDEFAHDGGTIQFFTERNRLRMIINLAAVRAAGLGVSSKLLRLAEVIKEDSR